MGNEGSIPSAVAMLMLPRLKSCARIWGLGVGVSRLRFRGLGGFRVGFGV